MSKMRLYRKIILFELGVLATWILHHFVTQGRGYKAIGGEFLLIPLVYVLYTVGQALKDSWEEIKEAN